MASRAPARQEPEVARALSRAAERLREDITDVSDRVSERLSADVGDLGDAPELAREVSAAVRDSVLGWLEYMRHGQTTGTIALPPATTSLIHTFVLRGASSELLLRLYRLGHGLVFREWMQALRAEELSAELMDDLVSRSLDLSFAYVDSISIQISESYAQQRARLVRSADAARAETARAIVAGETVDAESASRTLGYELQRWHVGMVLWADPDLADEDPISRIDRLATALAEALGAGKPLLVPVGRSLSWAWCGATQPPSQEVLAALARVPDVWPGLHAAVGDPADGPAGFADTHAEAIEAHRVATLGGEAGRLTLYPNVDLVSLLTADLNRAQRFMRAELGTLATADDATLRLRATLRAYLDEGRSFVATARRLGVHENTVKYRVRQCEEALGHPVGERTFRLAAALLLADSLDQGT